LVAAICVVSLGIVLLATRVTRVQLPAKIVLAAGGITYPLYLLHMQLGYVIFTALGPQQHVLANTCAIVVGTFALAYGVWRFFEPSAHSSTRAMLTEFAGRAGLSVSPKTTERAMGRRRPPMEETAMGGGARNGSQPLTTPNRRLAGIFANIQASSGATYCRTVTRA
jgi:peptidoglycan/LPS O-acetylase OafA/YrhL